MKREKLIKLNQNLNSYRDRVRLRLISDLILKLSQNNSVKLSLKLDLLESKKKLKSFLFSLNKEKSLVLPRLVNKEKLGNKQFKNFSFLGNKEKSPRLVNKKKLKNYLFSLNKEKLGNN